MSIHLYSLRKFKQGGNRKELPQKRNRDRNVPYQFEVSAETHAAGKLKAQINGVDIAPFMRMAYEQFVDRPIEESLKMLRKHNTNKSVTVPVGTVSRRKLTRRR